MAAALVSAATDARGKAFATLIALHASGRHHHTYNGCFLAQ